MCLNKDIGETMTCSSLFLWEAHLLKFPQQAPDVVGCCRHGSASSSELTDAVMQMMLDRQMR